MKIICLHQGYELYGSDRSFIESVAAIRSAYPEADIEVVLPRDGPITGPLRAIATRIAFEPLFILRRKGLARLVALAPVTLPLALLRAIRRFRRADIVYINTTVVIDHMLAARLFPGKAALHVHEIPEGRAMSVFRRLLLWSRARIIFNSRATRDAYALPRTAPSRVIYNGIAIAAQPPRPAFDGTRPLHVLMLGRISRIKGQEVLIDAVARLPAELRALLAVRIVGDAFEDVAREQTLHALVAAAGLADTISFQPFTPDPRPHYDWADIVAIPSRRPESLGRVAIEAIAYGRPPLASAIGGLAEVVEDGRTGWLVPPDDAGALSTRLAEIATHPDRWATFPAAGRERYETVFSAEAVASAIASLLQEMLPPTAHPSASGRRAQPAGIRS